MSSLQWRCRPGFCQCPYILVWSELAFLEKNQDTNISHFDSLSMLRPVLMLHLGHTLSQAYQNVDLTLSKLMCCLFILYLLYWVISFVSTSSSSQFEGIKFAKKSNETATRTKQRSVSQHAQLMEPSQLSLDRWQKNLQLAASVWSFWYLKYFDTVAVLITVECRIKKIEQAS